MRSNLPTLAALLTASASSVSAVSAPAYLLQSASFPHSSPPPSLSAPLARLILDQRLDTPNIYLSDVIPAATRESSIQRINAFGRHPALFSGEDESAVKQLVVLVEGVDEDEVLKVLGEPAFVVGEAPGKVASEGFLRGHPAVAGCGLQETVDMERDECWEGMSSLVHFDAQKDSSILSTISTLLPKLTHLSTTHQMESLLLFLPSSSSHPTTWDTPASELRRRQSIEAVMTEAPLSTSSNATAPPTSPNNAVPVFISGKNVPACFADENACLSGTNSCSGHGVCINRWAGSSADACFVCSCVAKTSTGSSASTGFAGKACEKEDYSTPFALFVGFSVVMVGVLSFSVSLLYSIGEEPLPGVIGAGVVKK